ncbi:acetyltransferase [Ligilactobacillus pabuli]|uniref:Acetyltransferase n=1 Tax=Ligilactobacillus pabuli TaxID=2886039 RepID=A0ABQ5JJM6_9LACO|nr:GNAT family protein [Ligilactobacillus pabuli]GKS81120.1 acetyltransferase [Ligilactobacillus pabuli]
MFSYQIDDQLSLTIPRPQLDAEPLFKLVDENRSYLSPWLPWVPKMASVRDEEQFLTSVLQHFGNGSSVNLVIRDTRQPVGMISLNSFRQQDHSTEIGYWLGQQFAGQNIMHRAVLGLCDLSFTDYDLNKIEIHAAVENLPSNNVAQKAGFHLDGQVRAQELLVDGYHDGNVWSLLKDEWQQQRSVL